MRIKKDESCEKLVIAKIGASAAAFLWSVVLWWCAEAEIVGSGCLTKSDCKVKINVLVDLSAVEGLFLCIYTID